jgi:hypothetical protein
VLETSVFGCVGKKIVLPLTIFQKPVTQVAGTPFYLCPQNLNNRTYTAQGQPGSVFRWTVAGGTVVAGQGSPVITINWQAGNLPRSLQVQETSINGCQGVAFPVPVLYDGAELLINFVTGQPDTRQDSSLTVNFALLQGQNFPDNLLTLSRRKLGEEVWEIVKDDINKSDNQLTDKALATRSFVYEYKLSTRNRCGFLVESFFHHSILLKGEGVERDSLVVLRWNTYDNWQNGVKEYQIWRRLDNKADFELYATAGANATEFSAKNARDGFLHTYKIKALERNGNGYSWSNAAYLTFEHPPAFYNVITPGVVDNKNDTWEVDNLELYSSGELTVFNRWGREVYSNSRYRNDFSGEGLGNGLYFYTFTLNSFDFTDASRQPTGDFKPVTRQYRGMVSVVR